MKCKNLVIITGVTCNGKTHITLELKKITGWHSIHTDMFYHPMTGKSPKGSVVGRDNSDKVNFIKKHYPNLTETTIIEGSHIGNKAELELFKKYLGFNGKVYVLKVESENYMKWYRGKYPHHENKEEMAKSYIKWFDNINDLEIDKIVSNTDDVINFLKEKNVYIPR
jgi:hypothetical protein